MRKQIISILLLISASFGLVANANNEAETSHPSNKKVDLIMDKSVYQVVNEMFTPVEGKMGGTLRLQIPESPKSFLQYGILHNPSYSVQDTMFDPLVSMNPVTFNLEPGLAKDWTVSPDGKTVIFNLRKTMWSDGIPFTADDVIFTYENFLLNNNATGNSVTRFTINGELVKFSKVDDYTVKAELPAPYGPFFMVLSAALIYPEHKLASLIDPDDDGSVNNIWPGNTSPEEIVCTGSYKLVNNISEQKVILEKNQYSWRMDKFGNVLPYFDNFEFLIVQDAEMATANFIIGDIDYMDIAATDFPLLKRTEIKGDSSFKVYTAEPTKPTPSPLHIAFNFNAKNPELAKVFSNVKFRHAAEYALDRDKIIEQVYNGLAVKGGVPVLPSNDAFYNPEIEKIRRPHNPEKAAEILDSLGLKDTDGDGWRELSDGSVFEFVLTTVTGEQGDAGFIYTEALKELGIKAELHIIDPSLRGSQILGEGNFEASLWAFGNQPDPQLRKAIWQPGNALYYAHFSTMDRETKTPIIENLLPWEKEVWEAFEKGQVVMDPAERKIYYDKWQELYAEYVPFIFIAKGMNLMGAQNSLENFISLEDGRLLYTHYTVARK